MTTTCDPLAHEWYVNTVETGDTWLVYNCWHCDTKSARRRQDPHPEDDPVVKPSHYNWHPSGVECMEIASEFNYFMGNAIKYIWRADHKGKPIEDLKKARNCIDLEISRRLASDDSKGVK